MKKVCLKSLLFHNIRLLSTHRWQSISCFILRCFYSGIVVSIIDFLVKLLTICNRVCVYVTSLGDGFHHVGVALAVVVFLHVLGLKHRCICILQVKVDFLIITVHRRCITIDMETCTHMTFVVLYDLIVFSNKILMAIHNATLIQRWIRTSVTTSSSVAW